MIYTEKNYKEKSELHNHPEKRERLLLAAKQIESDFLDFLDEKYGLGMFFYPGSGWDKVPKETLGLERVVHLSLEETKGDTKGKFCMQEDVVKYGYFGRLGEGIKVQADFRTCPFKDNVFDSCFIHYVLSESTIEARGEIERVMKKGALLIIAKAYHKEWNSKRIHRAYKKIFKPLKVKHEFANKFYVLKK